MTVEYHRLLPLDAEEKDTVEPKADTRAIGIPMQLISKENSSGTLQPEYGVFLLMGRTGSGKSSLCECIRDTQNSLRDLSPTPQSQTCFTHRFAKLRSDVILTLDLIDTVGLSDLDRKNGSVITDIHGEYLVL